MYDKTAGELFNRQSEIKQQDQKGKTESVLGRFFSLSVSLLCSVGLLWFLVGVFIWWLGCFGG